MNVQRTMSRIGWGALAGLLLAGLAQAGGAAAPQGTASAPAPQGAVSAPAPDVPLVERAKFFGNPTRTFARISPDGRWLSWIAPRDGVLNVWVAPSRDPARARPVTDERTRPIRSSFWSPDSKTVLFVNDRGGDENDRLYGVDVASGEQRSFTPFEKTRAQVMAISRVVKDRILVGLNQRDARWHDVYALDLASGKLTLVLRNDGYAGFVADQQLRVRVAVKPRADGGEDFHRVADGKVEDAPFAQVGLEDAGNTAALGFTVDGRTLYWSDSRGRDTAALVAQDVETGRTRVVAEDRRADIAEGLYDPKTGRAQAYAVNHLKRRHVALDRALQADLDALERAAGGGDVHVVSRTDDDRAWVVTIDAVTAPEATWLYERPSRRLTRLFVSRPELEGAPLVPMFAHEIRARDGLTLVSYLSLPKAADRDGDGRPERPAPMVLLVHGGPWWRDRFGYHGMHQWLANRGYAVLSVNFRGSTGFGKAFISAADREWGGKMQDDLLDAVQWAAERGVTTREQVAIMGGSYGGYATLAALAFTPTAYACGVDIVGPSSLFTLMENMPAYWESGRSQLYRRIGDPTTEAGQALLRTRSPLHSADRIARPLLIGQGANDPRVTVRESEQIVQAMAAQSIPVTYVEFPDEGHGFARPVNRIAFFAVTESFLAQCLGGRAEPIGDALKASTAQVKHGAEFARGVKEALAVK